MNKLLFLVVVAVAALGWAIWKSEPKYFAPEPEKTTEASAQQPDAQPAQTPVKLPLAATDAQPRDVILDDLAIVRGHVVGRAGGMLIVDCPEDPPAYEAQAGSGLVDAYTGAAGSAAAARWAVEVREKRIEKEYGRLERIPMGYGSKINGCERVVGRFAVCGYPKNTDRLHVVAAATGEVFEGMPVYTLKYAVHMGKQAPPPRPSIFPPGVDTPEQRHEYLKALTEERQRKAAGAR